MSGGLNDGASALLLPDSRQQPDASRTQSMSATVISRGTVAMETTMQVLQCASAALLAASLWESFPLLPVLGVIAMLVLPAELARTYFTFVDQGLSASEKNEVPLAGIGAGHRADELNPCQNRAGLAGLPAMIFIHFLSMLSGAFVATKTLAGASEVKDFVIGSALVCYKSLSTMIDVGAIVQPINQRWSGKFLEWAPSMKKLFQCVPGALAPFAVWCLSAAAADAAQVAFETYCPGDPEVKLGARLFIAALSFEGLSSAFGGFFLPKFKEAARLLTEKKPPDIRFISERCFKKSSKKCCAQRIKLLTQVLEGRVLDAIPHWGTRTGLMWLGSVLALNGIAIDGVAEMAKLWNGNTMLSTVGEFTDERQRIAMSVAAIGTIFYATKLLPKRPVSTDESERRLSRRGSDLQMGKRSNSQVAMSGPPHEPIKE